MTSDQEETKTEYGYNEIAYEWLVRNHMSSFIVDLTTGENLEDGDIDRTAETIARRAYNLSGDIFISLMQRYQGGYYTHCNIYERITLSKEAKDALFPRLDGKDEELAVKVTSKFFKMNKFPKLYDYWSGRILMNIVEDSKIDPVHDSLALSLWPLVLERAWENEPNGRLNYRDGIRNDMRVYCLLRNSPSLYMRIGKGRAQQ